MARPRKQTKKPTLEERMLDVWNQQVFLIKRKFPEADRKIHAIQKTYQEKGEEVFSPTEAATEDLRRLYIDLSGPLN